MEMGGNHSVRRGDHANLLTGNHAVSRPDLGQNMSMHCDYVLKGTTFTSDKNRFSQEIITDGNDFTGYETGNFQPFSEETLFPRVICAADHIHSFMGTASPRTSDPPFLLIQEIHTRQENDIFDGLPSFPIQVRKLSGIAIKSQHRSNFHENGLFSGKMNYCNFTQITHHAGKMIKVIKKIKE
jgi:hypothetical protein